MSTYTDYAHAILIRDGQMKKAHHQRSDKRGKESCSFCGVGQVELAIGDQCRCCGARVVHVMTDAAWQARKARE